MAGSLPYLRTLMVLGLLGFLLCMALIFAGCHAGGHVSHSGRFDLGTSQLSQLRTSVQ